MPLTARTNRAQQKSLGIYCLSTSKWIYKINSSKKIYPASITKLLTSLITLRYCNPNETITVSNITSAPQLRADLVVGRKYDIKSLLQALLVRSANDVALILKAYNEKKTKSKWTLLTRDYCKKMKMHNSNFISANGLHDNNHYTTIKDLVILSKEVYQNQTLMNILKMPSCKIVTNHSLKPIVYRSTNPFINKHGVLAGKTGYTPRAGKCFLFYFNKHRQSYVGVFVGTEKEKFKDTILKTMSLVP